MAGAAQRTTEAKSDVVTSLAALLERWQVRPRRNPRWLRDVTSVFEEQERAAYLHYQGVSALAVDIARLAGLSRWSQAAIRVSAFLAALARLGTDGALVPRKGWDGEIRRWRWVRSCMPIVEAVSAAGEGGRFRSRRAKEPPPEAPVLSLAQEFDQLTVGESGGPRMRTRDALQVLRGGNGRRFDGQLVDLLWSEAGQAVCDKFLRRRVSLQGEAVTLLKQSVQVLEKEAPSAPASSPREAPPRRATGGGERPASPAASGGRRAQSEGVSREEKTPDDRVGAADSAKYSKVPAEGHTRREEIDHGDTAAEEAVEERSREMTKSSTKEEEKVEAEAASAAAVHLQLAKVMRDLEEIRSSADRSLQTLASLAPAIEEFSTLISQLQRSFLRLQDGGSASAPADKEPERPRTLSLRVERPGGSLDADEVASALDNIRDLTDVSVQEHGDSWAVLQAGICAEVDLSILEAKVSGSLARHLGGDGASIEVSFL